MGKHPIIISDGRTTKQFDSIVIASQALGISRQRIYRALANHDGIIYKTRITVDDGFPVSPDEED